MGQIWYHKGDFPGGFERAQAFGDTGDAEETEAEFPLAARLAAAAQGELSACFDLGVAFSTGSHGACCDLVEAHKWFNLAAVGGREEAQACRAEVAEEMTAQEIAEAQRRARRWLSVTNRRPA